MHIIIAKIFKIGESIQFSKLPDKFQFDLPVSESLVSEYYLGSTRTYPLYIKYC